MSTSRYIKMRPAHLSFINRPKLWMLLGFLGGLAAMTIGSLLLTTPALLVAPFTVGPILFVIGAAMLLFTLSFAVLYAWQTQRLQPEETQLAAAISTPAQHALPTITQDIDNPFQFETVKKEYKNQLSMLKALNEHATRAVDNAAGAYDAHKSNSSMVPRKSEVEFDINLARGELQKVNDQAAKLRKYLSNYNNTNIDTCELKAIENNNLKTLTELDELTVSYKKTEEANDLRRKSKSANSFITCETPRGFFH